MSKDLTLNLTTTEKEVILRTGEALKEGHALPINISGTLQAPFQFYDGKQKACNADDCHILIQNDKGIISLIVEDIHPFSRSTITGSLTKDKVLELFKINTEHRWGIQEFLKFIKTMSFYFADRTQHQTLIASLQKWRVKVERVITEHNDQKGNSDFQLQTKVQQSAEEGGLLTHFDLNIPIFQGYPKAKFKVEIGLDPRNTVVDLFLISDELIVLEIGQREKLIQDELDKFSEFPCSKIVVS